MGNENLIQKKKHDDPGNRDPEIYWEQAYALVENRKKSIAGYARRFLAYSSYSLDEFVQTAYESAYKAVKKCAQKNTTEVAGHFWKIFHSDCCGMADIPSKKAFFEECIRNSNGDSHVADEAVREMSKAPVCFEEYREYGDEDAPAVAVAYPAADPLEAVLRKEEDSFLINRETLQQETIRKALAIMTRRERQVWEYLLGNKGKIPEIKELVSILGLRKQRVLELRNSGLAYVKKIFSLHKQLYSCRELSEMTGYSEGAINVMRRCGYLKNNEDYVRRNGKGHCLFTERAFERLLIRRDKRRVKAERETLRLLPAAFTMDPLPSLFDVEEIWHDGETDAPGRRPRTDDMGIIPVNPHAANIHAAVNG